MDSAINNQPMRGILAAVLTPMTSELEVDQPELSAHCRRLLDAGCHALGLFGTTGEANSLSVDERLEGLRAVVAAGIPVHALLPGTGACALPDAVRLTRGALELGVRNVLVLPPFYYKDVTDDGLFRFFAELLERVGDDRIRLFLYNFQKLAVVGFSIPLIERLVAAFPSAVAGTKDSDGDPVRIERICREFPNLAVFTGSEGLLLDTLRWGGAGCISATCNVTSSLARRVYELHAAGRDEEAGETQRELNRIRTALDPYPVIPTLKGILRELNGRDDWQNLRPPLDPPDAAVAGRLVRELSLPLVDTLS
jgi:4-hydroxy-tetrahydrodipicolinate synthase